MVYHYDFEGQSLPALLRQSAERFSDRIAIVYEGKTVDYSSLNLQSDRLAAFLAERGIGKGDRVGLYSFNTERFPVAYYGILKAGAIVVPVNVLLSARQIGNIYQDAGIKGLVYHAAYAEAVAAFKDEINTLSVRVQIGDKPTSEGTYSWEEAFACGAGVPSFESTPDRDTAVIIYTSGTTGCPKGAMLSHRNLASNCSSAGQVLEVDPENDTFLVALPMFHAFAATVGMNLPLLTGSKIALLTKFDPPQVADTIEAQRATVFMGVPTMYNMMLRLPDEANVKLQSLRVCISGGAAMPLEVLEQFEKKFGKAIYEGDGPTECSPVTCVNPLQGPRKPGSVGVPIPNVEMIIMDEAGREKPRRDIGEICVRGPNVMQGYWNLPEATKETFFGDWLRTGDLGYEDEDGYFYIVDRLKDMMIVNGVNVYPRVIEEVLYRFPAIREAAVVGKPDKLHGEIPIAFVSVKDGETPGVGDIREFCRDHLGHHEVPRTIYFLDELPKNATGKIVKRFLSEHGEFERGIE